VTRRLVALLALVLAFTFWCSAARADDAPALSEERVVLRTVAGDLVLVLYPGVAPKTVAQILKLVRAGVYDSTAFVRIEPGFVAQVSAANDRTNPLAADQQALIHKIPAEFSSLPHVRGVLSMAREDADVDSNETSFSILLGPAPHLDKKYTVFGRLESGEAVLDEMLRVPRGPGLRPLVRLEVNRAEVIPASSVATAAIAPARAVAIPEALANAAQSVAPSIGGSGGGDGATPGRNVNPEIAYGLAFLCLVGLASFFLQGRVPSTVHGSLNLVMVLIGAFVLVIVLTPHGHRNPWLATMIFFGLIGIFKVLGKFERPSEM
jgi:cyclophilin family peptidyl-prolyl cis-trans isomerase